MELSTQITGIICSTIIIIRVLWIFDGLKDRESIKNDIIDNQRKLATQETKIAHVNDRIDRVLYPHLYKHTKE